jgi:transposase
MDAASLPTDVAELQQLVVTQSATLAAQQRQIEQFKHYIAILLRARYGPRSEKVDPHQLALFDLQGTDGGETDPSGGGTAETADEASLETVVRAHRRRSGGRTALPENLPREQVEHDLTEHEKACPECGRMRERIGSETSEQLDLIPAQLKIIEHVRHKYACRHCQEHVATAPAAAKPIDKGLPGPGLLAQLVVSKYAEHKPLYRLEDELARYGVEISRGTLCRWARCVADLVRPVYDLLAARVRASKVIHTDDTPMPVLDASLPHTRTARLWVYCGDQNNPYTVYDYTTSRRRDGPEQFLKDFAGYLQADAFAGYDGIYAAGSVQQVLCWAHARRKFFEAKEAHPDEAHRALAFIGLLYDVEREAKPLTPERRWKLRRARSLGILERFHIWLTARREDVLPQSPLGQAIRYVLPRWDGFTRYCDDGDLAIDNNLSERMIRPCTIGRKNYLFFGSDRGGRTAAVLYSLMASCKANAVEPWAYLHDLLTRLPTLADSEAPPDTFRQFLPNIWLQSHPQNRRSWSH